MDKNELLKYLKSQNFSDKIVDAFKTVDRSKYVPEELKSKSYLNTALPIGFGQTISQPYTIAFMLRLLELKDNQKILEIGSGSGYVLDLISRISKNSTIFGVERIRELADKSRQKLKSRANINVISGDGSQGLKEFAPFDRILVSASSKEIPEELIKQLKDGGILVVPVNKSIIKIKKKNEKISTEEFKGFIFVPLIVSEEN